MSRSKTESFTVEELEKEWRNLLILRKVDWDWTGKDYQKPHKNQSNDLPGLELHKQALMGLCRLAPGGFPGHVSLRACFQAFDIKYHILGNDPRGRFRSACEATDTWRKMCKDAIKMKRTGVWPEVLNDMMAVLVSGKSDGAPQASAPAPAQASAPAPVAVAASAPSAAAPLQEHPCKQRRGDIICLLLS